MSATAVSGCNRNDGDIGKLYGQWMLADMTIDGRPAEIRCKDYSWRFQSNVVCITVKLPYQEYQSYFGSWSDAGGNRLDIDFTYAPEGGAFSPFNPPPGMRLSGETVNVMDIVKFTSSSLVLSHTDESGSSVVYTLRKLN